MLNPCVASVGLGKELLPCIGLLLLLSMMLSLHQGRLSGIQLVLNITDGSTSIALHPGRAWLDVKLFLSYGTIIHFSNNYFLIQIILMGFWGFGVLGFWW